VSVSRVRLPAVWLIAAAVYFACCCTESAVGATRMAVGCELSPSSEVPSEAPRSLNAAPVQYLANEGRDPATFVAPAIIFAKLGASATSPTMKLKRCLLERWFQTGAAHTGTLYVIEARRTVYEVVTTFDFYEGKGGAWRPGFRIFIIDAATGDPIITTTGGHLIRTSRPQLGRTLPLDPSGAFRAPREKRSRRWISPAYQASIIRGPARLRPRRNTVHE